MRYQRYLPALLGFLLAAAVPAAQAQVVKMNSALDDIIPADAKVELVVDNPGKSTLEGPIWVNKGSYLLYSNFGTKSIHKWDPTTGQISLALDHTGSNGVTLDKQGRVVFCASDDRAIERVEEDGKRTVLANQYEGKKLNRPNDLVYKSDGVLYFTDPSAGMGHSFKGMKDDPDKQLPFNGVYLLKDGKLQLASKDLGWPNGLVFSPDEKYLYVDDTFEKVIKRFDVLPDDTIANPKVIYEIKSDMPHLPDGMKVDQKGNIYGNGPGGLWILSPEGKLLGIVVVPTMPANFAFGDADGKSLFMTAPSGVYRIRLKIPGIRP
jgi:gluconolactonase